MSLRGTGLTCGRLLRIRAELQRLLGGQAARLADPAKGRAYQAAQCETLLRGLMVGISSHPRQQAEVAHWRETLRRHS